MEQWQGSTLTGDGAVLMVDGSVQWRSVKWWRRDVKERWKGVEGRKSVKSDVDALNFDGEALIGAADALNGDGKAVMGDEESFKGDHETLNDYGKALKGNGEELKCAG